MGAVVDIAELEAVYVTLKERLGMALHCALCIAFYTRILATSRVATVHCTGPGMSGAVVQECRVDDESGLITMTLDHPLKLTRLIYLTHTSIPPSWGMSSQISKHNVHSMSLLLRARILGDCDGLRHVESS